MDTKSTLAKTDLNARNVPYDPAARPGTGGRPRDGIGGDQPRSLHRPVEGQWRQAGDLSCQGTCSGIQQANCFGELPTQRASQYGCVSATGMDRARREAAGDEPAGEMGAVKPAGPTRPPLVDEPWEPRTSNIQWLAGQRAAGGPARTGHRPISADSGR